MTLTFNTDVSTKILSNHLNKLTDEINKSIQRLSTGKKFSSVADDPAGYFMTQRINKYVSSAEIGVQNVQLAKSELTQRSDTVKRINGFMRDALNNLEAYNEAQDEEEKAALLASANAAIASANQLKVSSKFNGKDLFPTTPADQVINLGDESNITIASSVLGVSFTVGTTAIDDAGVATAISALGADVSANASNLAALGVYSNTLDSTVESLNNKITNYEQTIETISSTDIARETAKLTQYQILQQVTSSLLSQSSSSAYLALSLITG